MTDLLSVSSGVGIVSDIDERAVAKAALEAAEEQLRSLCASHAGTFVSVERRGQALEAALRELQVSVKEVEAQVEAAQQSLEQQDESDSNSLAALAEKHRVRRRTLLQHSSLLELLELPSLMDACVRSNLYEEALSIAAFANTLERRHTTTADQLQQQHSTKSNVVVARVIDQIRARQSDLRRHLLHRLKQQVTMPQCLEIVTALRRLNSIDLEQQQQKQLDSSSLERAHTAMELRLQVDFLEARDAWLDSPTPNSGSSTFSTANTVSHGLYLQARPSEQLLDTIERYRTRVFEIATQFNAIFRAQSNAQDTSVSLISMWTSRRVHQFLSMLAGQIHRMEDAASLRDALEACVFFSTSMARLGADFTALLPSLFEPKMVSIIVDQFWKDGIQQLSETLKVCRDAGVASPLVSHTSTALDPSTAALASVDNSAALSSTAPPPPPRQLMVLPALARFVNSILSGLNELRRCLLPGIFSRLRSALNDILTQASTLLQTNERAVLTPGLRGEAAQLREVAAMMKKEFQDVVAPYLQGSLIMALGNDTAAKEFYQQLEKKEEVPPEPEVNEEEPAEEPAAATDDTATTPASEETKDEETTPEVQPTTTEESAPVEQTVEPVADENQEAWDDPDGAGDDSIYD